MPGKICLRASQSRQNTRPPGCEPQRRQTARQRESYEEWGAEKGTAGGHEAVDLFSVLWEFLNRCNCRYKTVIIKLHPALSVVAFTDIYFTQMAWWALHKIVLKETSDLLEFIYKVLAIISIGCDPISVLKPGNTIPTTDRGEKHKPSDNHTCRKQHNSLAGLFTLFGRE